MGTLRIRTYGQSGQESTSLGSDDQGGVLWVSNTAGTLVAHLGVDVDGGAFWVSNNAGDSMVMIAVESGGAGGFVSVSGSCVHDVAEVFDLATRDGVVPGTVMSVDALGSGGLKPAAAAYDRKVVA